MILVAIHCCRPRRQAAFDHSLTVCRYRLITRESPKVQRRVLRKGNPSLTRRISQSPFIFHVRQLLQMENRKANRVVLERGFAANMMAIDGTWLRPCTMQDVSETGARLTVDGSIEGLSYSRNSSCYFQPWETRTGAAN